MKVNSNIPIKLAAVSLLITTLACGSVATPPPSADAVASIVAGTLQAMTPLASPTMQPPTTGPLPTSTTAPPPAPTTSNLPAATRINFATGATHAAVEGSFQPGQTLHYVVRASKDQPLLVGLLSADTDAKLSIFGANGTVLLPAAQQQTGWQGILPATQDYYFDLAGASTNQIFTLDMTIPARIQFAPGQNKITITAQTVDLNGITYVAYALAGQKMDVTINTDPSVAALTIYGLTDGQPYARAQNGVTDFSMTLPSTQDYIIHVVPHSGGLVNYKLTVKIQ